MVVHCCQELLCESLSSVLKVSSLLPRGASATAGLTLMRLKAMVAASHVLPCHCQHIIIKHSVHCRPGFFDFTESGQMRPEFRNFHGRARIRAPQPAPPNPRIPLQPGVCQKLQIVLNRFSLGTTDNIKCKSHY